MYQISQYSIDRRHTVVATYIVVEVRNYEIQNIQSVQLFINTPLTQGYQ